MTLGGSDPYAHTAEIISDLTESCWYAEGGRVTAVLGSSYAGVTPWLEWSGDRTARLSVVQHPGDFVDRCIQADLAWAASGRRAERAPVTRGVRASCARARHARIGRRRFCGSEPSGDRAEHLVSQARSARASAVGERLGAPRRGFLRLIDPLGWLHLPVQRCVL